MLQVKNGTDLLKSGRFFVKKYQRCFEPEGAYFKSPKLYCRRFRTECRSL